MSLLNPQTNYEWVYNKVIKDAKMLVAACMTEYTCPEEVTLTPEELSIVKDDCKTSLQQFAWAVTHMIIHDISLTDIE